MDGCYEFLHICSPRHNYVKNIFTRMALKVKYLKKRLTFKVENFRKKVWWEVWKCVLLHSLNGKHGSAVALGGKKEAIFEKTYIKL